MALTNEFDIKEADEENESDDDSYGDSVDSIEVLKEQFKNDLKELEDKIQ